MTGPWAPLVLTVVVVVVVWVTLLCAARAHRLRLLHRRTGAARAGLEAALERRAAAALGVVAALGAEGEGAAGEAAAGEAADRMRAAVVAAGAGGAAGDREGAENALGRLLATADRSRLPPALRVELVEAEQLLAVARSVHNDAVRDTLGLRSRRLVKWLRLAGTAPPPAYFEIADTGPGSRSEVGSTPPR